MFQNWNGSIDDFIPENTFRKREHGYYAKCYSSSSKRILWQSPKDIPQEELNFLRRTFKRHEERYITQYSPNREKVSEREVDEKYEERRRVFDEKESLPRPRKSSLMNARRYESLITLYQRRSRSTNAGNYNGLIKC
jgi:murein L,D-transpeptidase YafK